MRESKAELMDRLRREGRWTDFVRRREALKAAGTAARDAWDLAAAEFPRPIDPEPGDGANGEPEQMTMDEANALGFATPAAATRADVIWVGQALGVHGLRPADAPSLAAWSMYLWARRDRTKFYSTIWVRLLARDDDDLSNRMRDDGSRQIELIDRLLAGIGKVSAAG